MNKTSDFKIFVPLLKAARGEDGRPRFHGVASSSIKDRHGDTITRSALSEMERSANENMTIFLNHSYEVPEDVAGSVERAVLRNHPTDPDIQDLVFDIVVNDKNDRAIKTWEAIDAGTKLGLSIGARIPEGGASRSKDTGRYVIDHVDLLETSIVGVPANPRSWDEYAVKSLNMTWADEGPTVTGDMVERSDGEMGIVVNVPADLDGLVTEVAKESAGTDPEDISQWEVVDETGEPDAVEASGLELEKAKKPAGHTHPHAHEHAHDHEHWNGIIHSHDHAHTHAHDHEDGHQHVDDKQGSEHDHSHMNVTSENHAHEESAAKSDWLDVEDLATHLAEFEAPPPTPETEDGDGADPAPQEAPSESGPENGDAPEEEAKELDLQPTLTATLNTSNQLMLSITRELVEAKTALVRVEQERDQALALAEKAMTETASLLKRLAATPMGKRTQVTEVIDDFESLKSVYGETFVDLLKKKD